MVKVITTETAKGFIPATQGPVINPANKSPGLQTGVDPSALIATRVRAMPPEVRERYDHFDAMDKRWQADSAFRHNEANELHERIRDTARNLADAERQERMTGPYRKEVFTPDGNNGGTLTVESTDYVAGMKNELDEMGKTLKKLRVNPPRPRPPRVIRDRLASPAPIIFEPRPATFKGTADEAQKLAMKFVQLEVERDSVISAPPLPEEALADLYAEVDKLAASPGIDGFARGHYIDVHGKLRFDSIAEILVPQTQIVQSDVTPHHIPNALGVLAWLFPDALKEKLGATLRENYPPGGMRVGDKPAKLRELDAAILDARFALEDAISYLERNGVTKMKRPKDSPWFVLLFCEPESRQFDFG